MVVRTANLEGVAGQMLYYSCTTSIAASQSVDTLPVDTLLQWSLDIIAMAKAVH
jgi:hypothetical protein